MSTLFSSFTIKDITLKNRIVVSPMCQYSAVDGFANDWHLVHLGSRAVGGAAMIVIEATAVSPEGRISPSDLGIWKDEHITKLKQITDFIKLQGTVPAIQLSHAGRKASTQVPWKGRSEVTKADGGWQTYAPSALAFADNYPQPEALDQEGIKKIIKDFSAATERAVAAGFQVIELHAAHGYLLHQFLSPLANNRTDTYGGSFENRTRLLLEVTQAVKAKMPGNMPLIVRISATDWVQGGWNLEESVQLAEILKKLGVDLIDVSTGGLSAQQEIPVAPNYQLPFATAIKKQAGIPTGAVGLITTPKQAESIISNSEADLIFMAREFLRNPYFPLRAAFELNEDIPWPNQYERAYPSHGEW